MSGTRAISDGKTLGVVVAILREGAEWITGLDTDCRYSWSILLARLVLDSDGKLVAYEKHQTQIDGP